MFLQHSIQSGKENLHDMTNWEWFGMEETSNGFFVRWALKMMMMVALEMVVTIITRETNSCNFLVLRENWGCNPVAL